MNELLVFFFDLHDHGCPWKFLEYVLQANHVPICPVSELAWVWGHKHWGQGRISGFVGGVEGELMPRWLGRAQLALPVLPGEK